MIADLFQKDVRTVNEHLINIFEEGELEREATIRQWATARLTDYLVKGFIMDDDRLKNQPGPNVPDYFDELLERIRDIRASERRMYLRVKEILALAADYTPAESETQLFFKTIQNKLHFAATGKTAPKLIAGRADASQPNMGLTTWKGEVVRKGDVTVAKNYLSEFVIQELNRIVVMFLDYAEDQAIRRKQVFLDDWTTKLDEFLRFNERRRAAIEANAEQDLMRDVEDTAKKLPKRIKKPKSDDS